MGIDAGDFCVREIPFPLGAGSTNGMVLPNDDGTFTILVNSRATHEQRIRAFWHEIDHIKQNDFYNGKGISEIENI